MINRAALLPPECQYLRPDLTSEQRKKLFPDAEAILYRNRKGLPLNRDPFSQRPEITKEATEQARAILESSSAIKKGHNAIVIRHEYSKLALQHIHRKYERIPKEKTIPGFSQFVWDYFPCQLKKNNDFTVVAVGDKIIIKVRADTEIYRKERLKAEKVMKKMNSSLELKGFSPSKSMPYGAKRFYILENDSSKPIIVEGWAHFETAHRCDCWDPVAFDRKEKVQRMASDVLCQLGILHANDIYQLDIHPGNICLTYNDRFKMIDFDNVIDLQDKRFKKKEGSSALHIFPLMTRKSDWDLMASHYDGDRDKEKIREIGRRMGIRAVSSSIYLIGILNLFPREILPSTIENDKELFPYKLESSECGAYNGYWAGNSYSSTYLKNRSKLIEERVFTKSQMDVLQKGIFFKKASLDELKREFELLGENELSALRRTDLLRNITIVRKGMEVHQGYVDMHKNRLVELRGEKTADVIARIVSTRVSQEGLDKHQVGLRECQETYDLLIKRYIKKHDNLDAVLATIDNLIEQDCLIQKYLNPTSKDVDAVRVSKKKTAEFL
ncbi:MAG: hypothetical protein V4489_09210 [Chlamydiota bacterium]